MSENRIRIQVEYTDFIKIRVRVHYWIAKLKVTELKNPTIYEIVIFQDLFIYSHNCVINLKYVSKFALIVCSNWWALSPPPIGQDSANERRAQGRVAAGRLSLGIYEFCPVRRIGGFTNEWGWNQFSVAAGPLYNHPVKVGGFLYLNKKVIPAFTDFQPRLLLVLQ